MVVHLRHSVKALVHVFHFARDSGNGSLTSHRTRRPWDANLQQPMLRPQLPQTSAEGKWDQLETVKKARKISKLMGLLGSYSHA